MRTELGFGYCGLACCLCSENESCTGCRAGGCGAKGRCKSYACCRERGLRGCWECERFPCSGGILDKPRIRSFARFIGLYGERRLEACLARNEAAGVVYHEPGLLTGDYDRCETEAALFELLLYGPEGPEK